MTTATDFIDEDLASFQSEKELQKLDRWRCISGGRVVVCRLTTFDGVPVFADMEHGCVLHGVDVAIKMQTGHQT